jgi:hypothetical protein
MARTMTRWQPFHEFADLHEAPEKKAVEIKAKGS